MKKIVLFILLGVSVVARTANAQSTALALGIEGNWLRSWTSGTYTACPCGIAFASGADNGFAAALRIALPIGDRISMEGLIGYSRLGSKYARTRFDTAVTEDRSSEIDTVVALNLRETFDWYSDYVTISPRLVYAAAYGLRISAGPQLDLLASSHEHLQRAMLDSTSQIRFQSSGTFVEQLYDGEVSNAASVALSLHLRMEYDIELGSISVLPNVEGSYLVTPLFKGENSNLSVQWLTAGLGVVYHI